MSTACCRRLPPAGGIALGERPTTTSLRRASDGACSCDRIVAPCVDRDAVSCISTHRGSPDVSGCNLLDLSHFLANTYNADSDLRISWASAPEGSSPSPRTTVGIRLVGESLGIGRFGGSGSCEQESEMIVAGVDIGSVATKAVVLEDGQVVGKAVARTGIDHPEVGREVLESALAQAGTTREVVRRVVTTGYGRRSAKLGAGVVTEITTAGRGAWALGAPWGSVRTVVDLGGQDSKVILLDESGRITSANPV